MKHGFAKIVPSRLMVVGLGTILFVLCVTAILMLLPGLVGRDRLADRLVNGLQSLSALKSDDVKPENLDRLLFAIFQANKTNRNISHLRFVDLNDGSIFTFDEKGTRNTVSQAEPHIWANLINRGKAVSIETGKYELFRSVKPKLPVAINLGIQPEVADEIEAQRRLSAIVGSIILATGIGILIMIWQTRQIEEAKGELELVLANTAEPVLMVDNYSRLMFANEPALALLGHPKGKKLKNRPLLSMIQNRDNSEFFARLLNNENTELDELETTLAGYPDKATFRASVMDVKTEVGRAFGKLLVLRNVTLEKRLEDKKVSQTIHELKGMLGEVKGFIRQALGTMEEESQREQRAFLNICLEKLEKSYNTVAVMIKSIVSAFKPHSLELRLRHCNLDEIIRSNVNDFEASLEEDKVKGLKLKLDLPERLPTVCCDINSISRVIMNLLLNAMQHCPEGIIEVKTEEEGEMMQVSIRDTGSGISRENLQMVFEPNVSFRQGGSGLGLSICRDFIKAHGGEIWAESEGKNKGTTFFFTLPKSRPVILVSDTDLANKLETECKKTGYYPIILDDLLTAIRRVTEINPNAILLDLDMENTISGISLAYRLKKTADTAKVPIIAFASDLAAAQEELSRYKEIALDAYLHKSFDKKDLDAAIRTVEAYWYLAQRA
jgi:signal transduction histidine kinase/ActR/RegA family two-component response regulator